MEEFNDIFETIKNLLNSSEIRTKIETFPQDTMEIVMWTIVTINDSRKKVSAGKTIYNLSHYSSTDICKILRALAFELQVTIEEEGKRY